MPTFYCNYFFLFGTRGPLTLGGPLDFAYPAYPIVTPLRTSQPQQYWSSNGCSSSHLTQRLLLHYLRKAEREKHALK